jgi:hypothetical protein
MGASCLAIKERIGREGRVDINMARRDGGGGTPASSRATLRLTG